MNTSKLWSALVVSCIACGSSFHSNDASTGGDGSGNSTSIGGDLGSGGDTSSAGTTSRGGKSGKGGGSGLAGSTSSGGDTGSSGNTSSGGNIGSGGDISSGGVVNVAGDVGIAGGNSGGGVVGSAGTTGIAGGNPAGGAAGSSSTGGGSSGSGCPKLWAAYTDLVTKSAVCDAGSTVECASGTGIVNECKCPVAVNHNSQYLPAAKKALQDWEDAGCIFKSCVCLAMNSPVCAVNGNTVNYTCQSSGSVISQ